MVTGTMHEPAYFKLSLAGQSDEKAIKELPQERIEELERLEAMKTAAPVATVPTATPNPPAQKFKEPKRFELPPELVSYVQPGDLEMPLEQFIHSLVKRLAPSASTVNS